ncbi:hypothetical protein [Pseudomonas sp. DWP1b1]|uniref:hypothetical protein n=1 Tax=unclassified Pseudomonas TaxID=196821 RepID=UPI003CF986AF
METPDPPAFMAGALKNAPDFALGQWNDRWKMSVEAVRCRHCLAPQWPSNADLPVRHCPGCELSEEQFPLRDLAVILSGVV